MITLKEITLRRGSKLLFEHVTVTIFAGQKVGIIGLNGCGKSSLFSMLRHEIQPDGGDLFVQPNIRIAYLAQEVPQTEQSALQYVASGDQELHELGQQLLLAEKNHDGHQIAKLHNRLYELGGYDLESRAAKVLVGLGFTLAEQQQAVNSFSGGWRMRLNLAKVLLSRADLLLLDEPTNYLDLDAIVWLERWLQDFAGTLLLISHDRDFLDNVIERVLYIGNCRCESYAGNYSSFELQRAERLSQELALAKKQQAKIEHLTKYINRFRAKASKARQAQSRLKMLEKMERVSITRLTSPFSFKFYPAKSCSAPLVSINEGEVAYGEQPVLQQINFSLNPDDAIGVLGVNGAGKSTFMKVLAQTLPLQKGSLFFNRGIKIGYFAQHQLEQLDLAATPLQHLLRISPEVREQQARTFLGGFGFAGEMVFAPLTNFSGGEKARLVLALLIWQKPNLLLLDEPTNHLDLEMREALTYALQEYNGALVLVAHDRYLLKGVVNEFYLVTEHRVKKFSGDLSDYQNWLLADRKKQAAAVKKEEPGQIWHLPPKKPKVNPLKLNLLAAELNKLHAEKAQLDATLSGSEIYKPENKNKLLECLKQSAIIEQKIQEVENSWLELSS